MNDGFVSEMIRLADEVYRQRGESGKSSSWEREIRRLVQGAESYHADSYHADSYHADSYEADSYELEWKISRGLFVNGETRPQSFARGAIYGRRAIKLDSRRVEGYFWAGVNLALHAQARKGLRGVLALLEAKRNLRRACEIAESYHGAGPLRVLGRLEHKSPKLLGGSLERSRLYYDRALAIAPTNSVTLVYAAELEIDRRDSEKAVALLQRILTLPIDPDWEFENIRDKTLATSMLEGLHIGRRQV
jgi:hypothetical protein